MQVRESSALFHLISEKASLKEPQVVYINNPKNLQNPENNKKNLNPPNQNEAILNLNWKG